MPTKTSGFCVSKLLSLSRYGVLCVRDVLLIEMESKFKHVVNLSDIL